MKTKTQAVVDALVEAHAILGMTFDLADTHKDFAIRNAYFLLAREIPAAVRLLEELNSTEQA